MRFHTKLMLMMGALLVCVIALLGISFEQMLDGALRKEIGTRALNTAKTIARMPEIKQAFSEPDPARLINPLMETIRLDTGAAFITVGNRQGIRYSHPDPEQIGKPMVGGDNEAVFAGHSIISETVGSLGPGLRGKTPIRDDHGNVIGVVSVGYLLEDIQETIELYRDRIIAIGAGILLLGMVGTLLLARNVKEAIFGLEPAQIGRMYQENQAVLSSIREGIVAVNTDGQITLANPTALELLGQTDSLERATEGEHATLVRSLRLKEVMETARAEFDQETFVGGKALVVNRVPILDKERRVMGAVASFRDRSELFRVTEELSRTKEYAEALRSQTHEYSNKLHLISALIQLESYQEAIELISAETNVHVKGAHLIMRNVPDPLIGGLLLGKVNQANERKISMVIEPESQLPVLPPTVDRTLLIVILGNLIDNAMEAVCDSQAHAREISVFLGQLGEWLIVEVEDRGPGIPEDHAELVFDRGFSTKKEHDHGYGLYLVKEAVEQLHGTVTHTGNPQGGTVFTVTIPMEEYSPAEQEGASR